MSKNQKVSTVKPFKRIGRSYPDTVKRKIVSEIQSGFLNQRAAERIYRTHVGLGEICALFGVTRQTYYDSLRHAEQTTISNIVVLTLVKEIRTLMPLMGTRKLMHVLEPKLVEHGIKMGRDQLFNLLRFHGLLIRRRKRIARTTDSNHIFFIRYPNLIKDLVVSGPEQLWVSDITYIRTLQGLPQSDH